MASYHYLLDIALILLGTKAFGLFTRKLRMPAVVGALIAGILLGPAILNWVQPSDLILHFLKSVVIVLMFRGRFGNQYYRFEKSRFKGFGDCGFRCVSTFRIRLSCRKLL